MAKILITGILFGAPFALSCLEFLKLTVYETNLTDLNGLRRRAISDCPRYQRTNQASQLRLPAEDGCPLLLPHQAARQNPHVLPPILQGVARVESRWGEHSLPV